MYKHKRERMTAIRVAAITMSLVIMGVAGCASNEAKEQAKPVVEERKPVVASPPPSQQPAVKPTVPAKVVATPIDPFSDPKNPLSKRSVYFDFDQYVIKDEFKPLVQAHSKYLGEHHTASVVIEGNCDERGSREYNLALGHRRADAVRRAIMLLGVSDQQIEAVSFGREKPVCEQHDEDCRSRNRRDDLKYRTK